PEKNPPNWTLEHGFLEYANYRIIQFDAKQGTRNLTLRLADDFGLDYKVSRSSILERSATFNYADYDNGDVDAADYLFLSALNKGLYENPGYLEGGYMVVTDNADPNIGYFISGGWLDAPSPNKLIGLMADDPMVNGPNESESGKRAPQGVTGGYTYEPVIITVNETTGETMTLDVYLWDAKIDGREDHWSEEIVTADRIIVFDNEIYAADINIMPVTLPIAELQYDEGLENFGNCGGLWTNTTNVTVSYAHDETGELSGITHIMFGGDDIVSVRVATTNPAVTASYKTGEWVPYAYGMRGVTNNYVVTVRDPLIQGTRNISIIGVRDRADNAITGNVTGNRIHTGEFYYDIYMPRDAENRHLIKNQHDDILNGKYYVGAPTYNLEFNFNGA
ncbi:hypothetical protein NO2_1687, partial [Candidatus Termititenax persephonae]